MRTMYEPLVFHRIAHRNKVQSGATWLLQTKGQQVNMRIHIIQHVEKELIMTRLVLLFSVIVQLAITVSHVPAHGADKSEHADIRNHRGCAYCGMDRSQYSHSRMQITYADNNVVGVCSIRCFVIELKAQNRKKVRSVEVADFFTKKMINAEKAYWVVGGSLKGVMTNTPKWALSDKAAAEKFINKYGGTLSGYEKVLAMAEKER